MKRTLSSWLGIALAILLSSAVHAQTTTLTVQGQILCASNGVDPPFPACSSWDVVDPLIRPGSTFVGTVTLPETNPLPGLPMTNFPNQTTYPVPVSTGEVDMSVEIEGFVFTGADANVPFPPPPGIPDDSFRVAVANDESFGFPTLTDLWSIAGVGSSLAIDAPFQFCDIYFASPGGTDASGASLGNIDSQAYFLPDSLQGPVTPWFAALRCQVVDLTQNPPFQVVIWGPVQTLTVDGVVPPEADAGLDQVVECTGFDGALVNLDGTGSSPSEANGGSYSWSVDGTQVAAGAQPSVQLALGNHLLTLTVSNEDGVSDTDTVAITVSDSVAPVVSAEMMPSGEAGHMYTIVANAVDVCDPAPVVEASVGASVMDGGTITIAKPDESGLVRFMSSMVELEVTATDASGNSATKLTSP